MATKLGDLMFPNSKYMKDGQEKTKWLNCGAVFQKDDGNLSVKIECLPVNMQEGWFNVFAPRDDNSQSQASSQGKGFRNPAPAAAQKPIDDEDDIPF
jgi:hypothetical protein